MGIDSAISSFSNGMIATNSKVLGKRRRIKKPPDILDVCDERRALKSTRFESKGAEIYNKVNRKVKDVDEI